MRKALDLIMLLVILLGALAACTPAAPAEAPAAQPTNAPAVEPTKAPAAEPTKAPEAPASSGVPSKIMVGVNSENPPWIFMKDGKMTGFEADMIEEFAKRMNITIEYKSAPFATVLTGVQSGQWDVAMSSIWVKKERMEVMDFADPYYDAQIGMMTPKTGGIGKFEEMKGKVFGCDTGSANESWLKEAQAKYGPYEVKSYDYWADAVLDLQAGRLDGVVVDAPIALYYIAQHPESELAMPLYIDDYHFAQSLAFKKGSALRDAYNKVQNEMKKDGTLKAIFVKWFGAEPPADSSVINIIPPYLPNEKPPVAGAAPAAPAAGLPSKIAVGVNSENPPWIFMKDNKMTGFEADMIEEFAKRSNITIEYKSAPFATVLTGVQSGQWDVAMSSIWVKKERMEVMDFADPYYDAQIGMMTPKTGGIGKFEEMKGKVFGCDTGSANESWLKEAQAKYGPYEVKSYDYWADAVLDLQAGRLDGVVVDAPIALYYIAQHPESELAMPLYIDDYHFAQSLAFKKGSALRDAYNKVQNEMKKDGTLKAIFVKWFGAEPPADSSVINIIAPYLPNEKPPVAGAAPAAPAANLPSKILVGVNSENPPWIFMKDNKMTGFEADMIEEFAKRSNITIEYKSAPFATVLTGVQSGQWDVAMSSIWVKKERMEVMDFADPYYDAQIGMMTPKTGGIAKFEEMKGKVFGCDTGSANESWLKEAQAKYGPYEVKSYDYWADAVLDLQAGRLDGVVVDAPIALYYIAQHPESELAMPLYIDDYHFAQSLAFKKGSALRDAYNKVQNEMKKDGTLKAIFVKWFGAEPPADSSVINIIAPYLPNEKPK